MPRNFSQWIQTFEGKLSRETWNRSDGCFRVIDTLRDGRPAYSVRRQTGNGFVFDHRFGLFASPHNAMHRVNLMFPLKEPQNA